MHRVLCASCRIYVEQSRFVHNLLYNCMSYGESEESSVIVDIKNYSYLLSFHGSAHLIMESSKLSVSIVINFFQLFNLLIGM